MSKTLYDKIWENHLVNEQDDGTCLIYVDRHLVHEVTSPQAFEGLRLNNRKVRRPELTLAVPDHNVPTTDRSKGIDDEQSRIQVETLRNNCKEFGVKLFDVNDKRQGIVHIIGPEQGFTQPGTVIVCGDSHTATHGAFGALAFGIGTSEVEHVLATQTLIQKKSKNLRINVIGSLPKGVTAKDVILKIIGTIGTAGGTGYVIEFAGEVIKGLSMEERMTVCNMTIEAGARAGLIAPDEKTFESSETNRGVSSDLVIAPPQVAGSSFLKRFHPTELAMASGWMQVRGVRRRASIHQGFVVSDHADWNGLIQTVQESQATQVYATHGETRVLTRYLNEHLDIAADRLETAFGIEEGVDQ